MRNTLLVLFTAFLLNSTSYAQPYIFSQYTSTYANLTSPTVISTQYWDDFTVYTLPMPFTFNYFGTNFNTLYVMGGFDGFVYSGTGSGGTFGSYELYTYDDAVTDLNGTATISYLLTGSAPNRILKVQTLNANFDNDDTQADYMNIQLWLYEGSNIVEMHYGPSSILNPSQTWQVPGCAGPTVTIIKDATSFVSLSGSASNPTPSSVAASLCVTGAPPLSKVYKFVPNAAGGVAELNNNISVTLYPNPGNGTFTIASEFYSNSKADLSITNNLGQTVYVEKDFSIGHPKTIHTGLQPGVYFVRIGNDKASTVRKLIIQ